MSKTEADKNRRCEHCGHGKKKYSIAVLEESPTPFCCPMDWVIEEKNDDGIGVLKCYYPRGFTSDEMIDKIQRCDPPIEGDIRWKKIKVVLIGNPTANYRKLMQLNKDLTRYFTWNQNAKVWSDVKKRKSVRFKDHSESNKDKPIDDSCKKSVKVDVKTGNFDRESDEDIFDVSQMKKGSPVENPLVSPGKKPVHKKEGNEPNQPSSGDDRKRKRSPDGDTLTGSDSSESESDGSVIEDSQGEEENLESHAGREAKFWFSPEGGEIMRQAAKEGTSAEQVLERYGRQSQSIRKAGLQRLKKKLCYEKRMLRNISKKTKGGK